MGKIKAAQLQLASGVFEPDGDGALSIADGGVPVAKLAGGITAAKLAQSLLNMIVTGQRQRESVLVPEQLLAGGSGGIRPATLVVVSVQPDANDNIGLKKMGSGAETFTFVDADTGAFQVVIGADADETMTNLAAAINAESANFSAVVIDTLDKIASRCVVIYCEDTDVADGCKVFAPIGDGLTFIDFSASTARRYDASVDANGALSLYAATDLEALPDSEVNAGFVNFGFKRAFADLIDGDLRFVMSANSSFIWDADGGTWNNAGAAVVGAGQITETELNASVAGAGLSGGGGTPLSVNVDDTTIEITGDSLNVKAGGIGETELGATSVTAAKLGADVAGNGLTGGNGAALAVLADGTSIAVSGAGIKAAVPCNDDKAMVPVNAVNANLGDTGLTLTQTPAGGSFVSVTLNGIQYEVGNGVTTKDCFFGPNNSTPRAYGAAVAGDKFFWNATVTGVPVNNTTDEFDFNYSTTAP